MKYCGRPVILLCILALTLAPMCLAEGVASFPADQAESALPANRTDGESVADGASHIISSQSELEKALPPNAANPPFQNARVFTDAPTQIIVEWDAPKSLWVMVEVWHGGDRINSKSGNNGKASVTTAPGISVVVTVSAGSYTETIEFEVPAGKSYREYGYQRTEAYTAFVTDAKKDFYSQPRKSVKSVTREELLGNLNDGYAYGAHISFSWQRTRGEKRLSDLTIVTKAPDGRVFVEESAPMTIPGNVRGAYFVVQINNALRHFLGAEEFPYGPYEFFVYTEGRLLGNTKLTVSP